MKLKTLLRPLLPMILSVSLPAYAVTHNDVVDTISVDVTGSSPSGLSITGSFQFDENLGAVIGASLTEQAGGVTEIFNTPSSLLFSTVPGALTALQFSDLAGDSAYFMLVTANPLNTLSLVGVQDALDSYNNSSAYQPGTSYDNLVGYLELTSTGVQAVNQPVLQSPIPEPATIALLASAVFGLSATRRKNFKLAA